VSCRIRQFRHFLAALVSLAVAVVAGATSVKPPSFDELVNGADCVVRARVVAIEPLATPRPGRPPLLHTLVTLDVTEVIAGEAPAQLVLKLLGGRVGDFELRVEGVPEFRVGNEDILFVHGNGRTFYPLYAVMHGRYPIKRDSAGRDYVARSNEVPLGDVAEVALPMTSGGAAVVLKQAKSRAAALTPAQFAEQIRSVRRER
jgi:hypothetical protein